MAELLVMLPIRKVIILVLEDLPQIILATLREKVAVDQEQIQLHNIVIAEIAHQIIQGNQTITVVQGKIIAGQPIPIGVQTTRQGALKATIIVVHKAEAAVKVTVLLQEAVALQALGA